MMVGLGCTKSSWTPDLLYTLAESREVLIIDHKGSGYSRITDGGEAVSIEDYGQSVLDLLAALGIKNPDVMGFSMVRDQTSTDQAHAKDLHQWHAGH